MSKFQHPAILSTADFLEARAKEAAHTEAVENCEHCNFIYAASQLRRLVGLERKLMDFSAIMKDNQP